jgi:Putative prokaryotic signal transducing protein
MIKVFVGSEASAILLKARLEEAGVKVLIKNDSSSAFLGVAPDVVDLYIEDMDIEVAEPIIREFHK